MKRKWQKRSGGRTWNEAESVLIAEVETVEESLGSIFLRLRTPDGRQWSYIAPSGSAFTPGERVRISIDFNAVTKVVAA
jgi:hypothetical protein